LMPATLFPRVLTLIFLATVVALSPLLSAPRAAVATAISPGVALSIPASVAPHGEHFVDNSGQPTFMLGANYEGPADRAWQMWNDGQFGPSLIGQDMARARDSNLSVLRVFVQQALATDIKGGRWEKLDQVLDLADQHGLRLILTFADYSEIKLADVV